MAGQVGRLLFGNDLQLAVALPHLGAEARHGGVGLQGEDVVELDRGSSGILKALHHLDGGHRSGQTHAHQQTAQVGRSDLIAQATQNRPRPQGQAAGREFFLYRQMLYAVG